MTITSVAADISSTGVAVPTFTEILGKLVADFQSAYGSDVYIEPDSQDGQILATLALGIANANSAIAAVYNAFSPYTAQGDSLSSLVKLYGLAHFPPQPSYVQLTYTGTPGTVITSGSKVHDTNGYVWKTYSVSVTLNAGGTGTGFAQCTTLGPIAAPAGSIKFIDTPITGWTLVTNIFQASLGTAVTGELDAKLRTRYLSTTDRPSTRMVDSATTRALFAKSIFGATAVRVYENLTNSTDSNGIPAGNMCYVVAAPTTIDINGLIDQTIPPGTPTYGGPSPIGTGPTYHAMAVPATIAANVTVKQVVKGVPITGGALPAPTITAIQNAIKAAINATPLGLGAVSYFGVAAAASPAGTAFVDTYEVSAMTLNKNGGSFAATDIALTFLETAVAGTVTVTVA